MAGTTAHAFAQDALTLDQALLLGRQRNTAILSAQRQVDIARAALSQSQAAFLPTVDLTYSYADERIDNFQVAGNNPLRTTLTRGGLFSVSTSWTILDTGERRLGVKSARFGLQAQQALSQQALRSTLADVFSLYVEALRAEELERVAASEVGRAESVVKQAEAQAKVGAIAEKDVYQPRADALNAKVEYLSAQNDASRAIANLKAGIGWDEAKPLPPLAPLDALTLEEVPLDPLQADALGLRDRLDLQAQRRQVDQFSVAASLAKVEAGPTLNADYSYSRKRGGLGDSGQGAFALLLSYPLYDGGIRRDDIRIAEANLDVAKLDLLQAERDARAQIESLVQENILGKQRIEAANLALEAAKINFEKVSEASRLGAEGTDLVAVSTAQVSLVVAETNAVQAQYDYAIARINLRLATGQSVPGE